MAVLFSTWYLRFSLSVGVISAILWFYFSPASMVYQRVEDVAHRVVTCLGCGWCTFVLRAQNAVQPPASLASHMSRCIGRGARLSATRLPPAALRRPPPVHLITSLTAASNEAGRAFTARFPGVRGYISSATAGASSTEVASVGGLKHHQSPIKRSSVHSMVPKSKPKEKAVEEVKEEILFNGNVSWPFDVIWLFDQMQHRGSFISWTERL